MTNKTYPNTALAFLIRFLKKYKLTFAETQHLLFDEESSGAFKVAQNSFQHFPRLRF